MTISIKSKSKNLLLQTCIEAYRMPVFDLLVGKMDPSFKVVAGMDYFTPAMRTVSSDRSWCSTIKNSFFLNRKLCYQHGWWKIISCKGTVIAELNPRIISTWLLFLTRRLLGKRSIFWGHVHGRGNRSLPIKLLRKCQLALSNGMVTYTESQASDLYATGFKSPIWNSNNSCVHETACIPVNGRQNRIVYVGRLVSTKKISILIKGFNLAFHDYPEMQLHIVGEGPEESDLNRLIEELRASNQITMHGRITAPEKLEEIYKDALAAASPGYVGLSCIQAMAKGVPMIISKDEPHSPEIEACIEEMNTIFFDTDNTESLAEALIKIQSNKILWKERSSEISKFIRAKYTMESMAQTLFNAFANIDSQ